MGWQLVPTAALVSMSRPCCACLGMELHCDGQQRGQSWLLTTWEDQCELTRGSSRGLNYCNQHFIWGLPFPSKHFHLGTSPASVWFVDICLVPAGMCITAFEVFVSRGEQKWPTPLISPEMQNRSKESRGSSGSEQDITQSCSVPAFSINEIKIYKKIMMNLFFFTLRHSFNSVYRLFQKNL